MPTIRPGRPTLSVVLCTYNRAELLLRTLDSLCRQSLDKAVFEIVVIDDGSTDDTRQVVQAYESLLPLRYSRQRNAGLGSARNHGVFLSRGEILVFHDDDDIAGPRLLEEHLETHRRYPEARYGVLGYMALDPAIAHDPLMRFVTRVGSFLFSYPSAQETVTFSTSGTSGVDAHRASASGCSIMGSSIRSSASGARISI